MSTRFKMSMHYSKYTDAFLIFSHNKTNSEMPACTNRSSTHYSIRRITLYFTFAFDQTPKDDLFMWVDDFGANVDVFLSEKNRAIKG